MKKNVVVTIVLIALGVFVLFGTLAAVLATSMFRSDSKFSWNGRGEEYSVDFDESYDLDGIDTIKVNVVSSEVNIYNSTDMIDVEFTGRAMTGNTRVEFVVQELGSTLNMYVKYPKVVFGGTWMYDSHVNIGIPESFAGEIIIDSVSGEVNLVNMANDLDLLDVDTTSGDLKADVKSINELKMDSTSGKCMVDSTINESVKGGSVSGDFYIGTMGSDADMFDVNTTSGKINVIFDAPCETNIDTVSGDVIMEYVNDGSIDLDFDSVSGDLDGDFSTSSSGTVVKVDTTSGDLTIK